MLIKLLGFPLYLIFVLPFKLLLGLFKVVFLLFLIKPGRSSDGGHQNGIQARAYAYKGKFRYRIF